LVSVLIACYNAERWIGPALESVFAQTWHPLEVIVVNDGSRDGSEDVVRRLARPNLKLLTQENRGQSAALNRALAAAQGDVIQFLDADDLLAPTKIALQMARLEREPQALVTCAWARFFGEAPAAVQFLAELTWRDMPPVDWLVTAWHDGGGMMFPAMWLLPRPIVDRAGPWREDLTLNVDGEYFARAVLSAQNVLFCAEAHAFYRSGIAGSMSSSRSRAAWMSQEKATSLCERHLLGREDSDRTRKVIAQMWQRFAYGSYPYAPDLADEAMLRAARLHAFALPPPGGPVFQLACKALGWRTARRLQRWSGRP
jgi:glycosyltransferase involved in cell wall biosynthesis